MMDKRPILRLIQGGGQLEAIRPQTCRSPGCAELAAELGFCAACLACYHARRVTNRDRYALLLEIVEVVFDFGSRDPFVCRMLAGEFLEALASQRYTDATALLGAMEA